MDLNLDISGNQIDGDRPYQEDSFLTAFLEDESGRQNNSALIIMADGMGGHAAGNVASQMVVNTFNRQFTSHFGSDDAHKLLRKALDKSNGAIQSTVEETPALEGMGCTMVAAVIDDGNLSWISVGDSHLYLLRSGELVKKNADHSYGAWLDRMAADGNPVTADPRLKRNMLRSAMTGGEIAEIDNPDKSFIMLPGDRLIVCSDGLDTLDNDTIRKLAAGAKTPKECVDALLQAVKDAAKPKQDNTTVIVIDASSRDLTGPYVEDKYVESAPEPTVSNMGKIIAGAVFLVAAAAAAVLVDWSALLDAPDPVTKVEAVDEPATVEDEVDDSPAAIEQPTEEFVAVTPAPVSPPLPAGTFRDRLNSGGEGPLMTRIPAGTFMMGSRTNPEPNEQPRHQVRIPAFVMGVYEVTIAEYERFARATGRAIPNTFGLDKDRFPVVNVSWDDVYAYVRWLSQETGQRYRLPSESEWEYAAAAGTDTPYWWGFALGNNRAHCFNCTPTLNPRLPTVIGHFEPNPFGLYDTAGNVAEWIHDCLHPNYRGAPADGSVWEGGDCSVRVVRGGHYESPAPTAQRRDSRTSNRGYADVGFRVARSLN